MNNDLKIESNDSRLSNHRASISSTRSLDVPITPSRSPKKVSFSDDVPYSDMSQPELILQTPTTTASLSNGNSSSSNDETISKTTTNNNTSSSSFPSTTSSSEREFNAVNHVLQQAASYLERLHGSRDYLNDDNDNEDDSSFIRKSDDNVFEIESRLPPSPSPAPPTPPRNVIKSNKNFQKESPAITPTAAAVLHLDNNNIISPSKNASSPLSSVPEQNKPKNQIHSTAFDVNGKTATATATATAELLLSEKMRSTSQATELTEAMSNGFREANNESRNIVKYNLNLDKNCSTMELEAKREKLRWLLISECGAHWGEGKHTKEGFRKLFLDTAFQQKLFRLFDLENKGHLTQDRWVEHLKGRLTDDRQMDFAEQLESVAYVICGENNEITFKNFCDIWQARGILDKLYRLVDSEGVSLVSTNQVMEFISHLTNSRPRTGFDKSSLERLEQLFRNTVGNEQEIRREEFKKIVTSKNPFFTERVFQIFDKDNSGSISLQEFIDSIHQFSGQSADDKIRFLFKVYDIDGDGLIQHKELHDVIRACMEENGMEFSDEQIEDLTTAMFEDADPYNRGEITYEALKNQLNKHGGLLENLSITIDRWLVPMRQDTAAKKNCMMFNRLPIPHQLTPAYMKNNQIFVTYLFIFIAVNVCLFISRAIQYRASNGFVIIARACGQCLNFDCAWILVLMLRHSLTYLRSQGLSSYLPLDHHIYLHKLTGFVISGFSILHTLMHLCNFSIVIVNDPNINAGHYTVGEWLLTDRPGLFGLIPGCANPTGMALFIILLIMFICSQPFVRRKGSFEVFYWTHLLYVPFWILLLFHGPNFWKWFLIPGLVYIIERILRYVWMRGEHGKTYISSGLLLPSKVIHLVIKRPMNFNFRPGDYVFINIPVIAKYEWHPFTISSAPEQEDYMWLHIRTVGEWTNRLYQYFEREQQKLHQGGGAVPHLQAIQQASSFMRVNENDDKSFENAHATNGTAKVCSSLTPQTDFLAQNLAKMHHSNSFDSGLLLSPSQTQAQQRTTVMPVPVPAACPPSMSKRQSPTTSKLATESFTVQSSSRGNNNNNNVTSDRMRSFKKTLQRTFSRKDQDHQEKQHSTGTGVANAAFVADTSDNSGGRPEKPKRRFPPESKLMLPTKPVPLEKSLSLPDMSRKSKKLARLRALHALGRSESERSFDETRLRRARLQNLGLAYLSPQNKSLAQSFRYMRNKPTIIAFKTPSTEISEPEYTQNTTSRGDRDTFTARDAEEGRVSKVNQISVPNPSTNETADYQLSKPLEDAPPTNTRISRLRRPTFLRTLSASIKYRGCHGSLSPANGNTNSGKVTLDAGVLEIFIDGPYGAPSSHIFGAQHAVLIATGIGVTPFASILQSIMHRYWKARHTCPRCQYEWSSDIPKTVMNLRKVDFFWINRDQRSFEWFVNLLSQLEIEQAELGGAMERFLEMHMYITSALQRTDMKAVGLQLALDLLHEKGKRDLITGLKTRTNAGRPNWDKVFKQLQAQKKGKVTVFYCGPPQLAKTLRYKCDEYGFAFRKECF